MSPADGTLLLGAGELVTLTELGPGAHRGPLDALETIQDGAVWMVDGAIRAVGATADVLGQLPPDAAPEVIDADGATVVPGLVDAHTHLLYEGARPDEYPLRLAGLSYLEIGRRGGGIGRTTARTREASFSQLFGALTRRLDRLLANGTTTVEVKTGYGLSERHELLGLDVLLAADRAHTIDIVPTFLAAHAVPPEYTDDPDGYVDLIIERMLPKAAERAAFCDVFCEEGYFTLEQSLRLLQAAAARGMRARVHADEITDQGAAALAAEVGAASADHVCCSSEASLRAMAQAGVIAVLLPATRFFLLAERYADARRMHELGVPVALGSDHSPTAPTESLLFVLGLACAELRMSAAEALVAGSRNAAASLGIDRRVGSLAVGMQADLLVLDIESYQYIPYYMTRPIVRRVFKRGRPVPAPA